MVKTQSRISLQANIYKDYGLYRPDKWQKLKIFNKESKFAANFMT